MDDPIEGAGTVGSTTATSSNTDGPSEPGGEDTSRGFIDEMEAPAQMAQAQCQAYLDCSCDTYLDTYLNTWSDHDACVTAFEDYFNAVFSTGQLAGLEYDPVCATDFVDLRTSIGCGINPNGTATGLYDTLTCAPYHGSAPIGAACSTNPVFPWHPGLSTCEADLVCSEGFCVARPGIGEPCLADDDTSPVSARCAAGLLCLGIPQALCQPLPGLGEACGSGAMLCAPGTHCDANSMTCALRSPEGAACVTWAECLSGVCDDEMVCTAAAPAVCGPVWMVE